MEALGSVAIGIIGIPALLITAACHGYHKQVCLSDTSDSDGPLMLSHTYTDTYIYTR